MGFFQDLFTNAPARDAAQAGIRTRAAGLQQTTGTLQGGYDEAAQYLDLMPGYTTNAQNYIRQGQSRYDPLVPTAQQGYQAYANLFGIGGGNPTAAVRNMPGYQFSQDEAANAVLRNAASTGALASGNTLQAIADRSANLADTRWQQYAQGLLPFLNLAPNLAQAQASGDTALANLEQGRSGYATAQAGLNTELARTLGGYQYGTAAADANALANAELARSAAAKNVFDAVMGGLKLATGAFTGGAGGGASPAQNFANMFGSAA